MVVRASKDATKGGEGVIWLKNEPYDNTDGHLGVSPISNTLVPRTRGQYTLKEYHLASRVPGIVKVRFIVRRISHFEPTGTRRKIFDTAFRKHPYVID